MRIRRFQPLHRNKIIPSLHPILSNRKLISNATSRSYTHMPHAHELPHRRNVFPAAARYYVTYLCAENMPRLSAGYTPFVIRIRIPAQRRADIFIS